MEHAFRAGEMHISRIKIVNFANFADFEVETGVSIVVVGENKSGKSNLLFALRLILDPTLSERDRQLGLEHFWDGLGDAKLGATVEIALDLAGFDEDDRLLAHLADAIVEVGPPMVARLTYRFRPKPERTDPPRSLADYEYVIFGGTDPDIGVRPTLRRMLPLDVLPALRDAEKDLATWRRSPLRPLLEGLISRLDEADRSALQDTVDEAHAEFAEREEVRALAATVADRLEAMVGPAHATQVSLGLAPTRIDALVRALRLLIDDGARGVAEASLGTANLIFLALKGLEIDRLSAECERDHTFLAVEEPEAHLHPQVQRLVFRHLLTPPLEVDEDGEATEDVTPSRSTTILTTHSTHIASIAPIRSIVLLRRSGTRGDRTVGVSAVNASLTPADVADLQRYVDVTRGEMFFARGVILVEGDAERFMVPAFAAALGIDLDQLGLSVCSVGGTNFAPYLKLLGPGGLSIPRAVVTDLDPSEGRRPRAFYRVAALLDLVRPGNDHSMMEEEAVFRVGRRQGMFVNANTLETDLFHSGLAPRMARVLTSELRLSQRTVERITSWVDDTEELEEDVLLSLIERVGKGRFAQRLARHATAETCPTYIRQALEYVRDAVS